MLNEEEVKALLVSRVLTAMESCNSHHITCVKGQVRGLLAVLTEEDPTNSDSITDILRQASIPFIDHGSEGFEFDQQWMADHGFEVDDDDEYHPIESW